MAWRQTYSALSLMCTRIWWTGSSLIYVQTVYINLPIQMTAVTGKNHQAVFAFLHNCRDIFNKQRGQQTLNIPIMFSLLIGLNNKPNGMHGVFLTWQQRFALFKHSGEWNCRFFSFEAFVIKWPSNRGMRDFWLTLKLANQFFVFVLLTCISANSIQEEVTCHLMLFWCVFQVYVLVNENRSETFLKYFDKNRLHLLM